MPVHATDRGREWERAGQSPVVAFSGIAVGAVGDLVVLVYVAPPRFERMRWMYDRCEEIVSRLPDTVLTLQIVLPSSTPPDSRARAETRHRLNKIDPKVRRLVTVAVGDDIKAAMVRVLMRGIFMLSPRRDARFVTETVPQGIETLFVGRSELTPRRHEAVALVQRCFDELDVDEAERASSFGNRTFSMPLTVPPPNASASSQSQISVASIHRPSQTELRAAESRTSGPRAGHGANVTKRASGSA